MKTYSILAVAMVAGFGIASSAQAQSAGNLLGAPLIATGNILNGVAAGHAGIAPVVSNAAPTAEPLTDGVTNAIGAVGAGVTATGADAQTNGLRIGQKSNGQSLVSIGTTNPALQGSIAAVANGSHP